MRKIQLNELLNESPVYLIEQSIKNKETNLTKDGALLAYTGRYKGRAANDKFIVLDSLTADTVDWDSNKTFSPEKFDALQTKVESYLNDRKFLHTQRLYAGVDVKLKFEITTTKAWHALFAKTMFCDLADSEEIEWKFLHAPDFRAEPEVDDTASEAFIIINYTKKVVLIGGTSYAGEIKKSVFTVLNFILPEQGILPMHSSVNFNNLRESVIFFGLSGTGKTTLSADPSRVLVGDDEHGWDNNGLFNFEDGCYAKVINLSEQNEPEIWKATNSFGTVLENVAYRNDNYHDGILDFNNSHYTENTRAAYKLNKISNAATSRKIGHPNNIIMLTCDAYGILPPAVRLNWDQAIYYFLSGYTAKIAGTEAGVKEPTATFSTCFGAPFLPRHPTEYANLLLDKIKKHNVNVWLVNTGWVNGPYGVGNRISLSATRKIVNTILSEKLHYIYFANDIGYSVDPNFGFFVPNDQSFPKNEWKDSNLYQQKAQELVSKFKNNFKKYESHVSENIINAGPR